MHLTVKKSYDFRKCACKSHRTFTTISTKQIGLWRLYGGAMYREITKELEKWKGKAHRKPLLLTGVRQCGKTYIVNEFAGKYL